MLEKLETLEHQVKSEISQIKRFLFIGLLLFILALISQVVIAVTPFYIFFLLEGIENPMFGAVSFGGVAVVVILLYSLRSVLFDFSKPDGVEVEGDCELSQLIDELSLKINAPKPYKVYLTDDFNAYVSTYKTFRHPIGKHYLSIGIQYLSAISLEELKSVVAHELGHLSKEHTDFSRFIYRIYHGLYQLDCVLANSPGFMDAWLHKALQAYLKRLDKLSYSTLRNHEFQADFIAAKVTSEAVTANLLCRTEILSDWHYDTYWKQVWRDSWKSAVPEQGTIKQACQVLSNCDQSSLSKYLDISKMKKTEEGDSHPCLKDRVEFLGQRIKVPEPIAPTQLAINILGKQKDLLIHQCEAYWEDAVLGEWQDYHFYMRDCVMKRDLLEKMKLERDLMFGEKIQWLRLVAQTQGYKLKLTHLVKMFKKDSENTWLLKEMLNTLFRLRDDRLVKIANRLYKTGNDSQKIFALEVLSKHYLRLGLDPKSEAINKKRKALEHTDDKRRLLKGKKFVMHDLHQTEVKQIEKWLKSLGNIDFALLCQSDEAEKSLFPMHFLFIDTPCDLGYDFEAHICSGLNIKYDVEVIDVAYHEKVTNQLLEKLPESKIFGDVEL